MAHTSIQLREEDALLFPRVESLSNLYHDTSSMSEYLEDFKINLYKSFYPVGAILILDNNTNPNTLFPETTWEAYSQGQILVGYGYLDGSTSKQQITFNKEVKGEAKVTLTVSQLPSHNHAMYQSKIAKGSAGYDYQGSGTNNYTYYTGGGGAHNNMMPYIAVNIWRRTG